MAPTSSDKDKLVDHVRQQVGEYRKVLGIYRVFAEVLQELLSQAVKDLGVVAIVQARAKTVPSFAEKVVRKLQTHALPVNQLTDLCGARVITENKNEIEPVCDFIRKHFEVDEANSEDAQQRLGVSEFGYGSMHFIVSLKQDEVEELLSPQFMAKHAGPEFQAALQRLYERRTDQECVDHKLPPGARFKAEIQVRTLLQHAWAAFGHDRIYKSPFPVPEEWERDANRIAATLEEADKGIARTIRGLDRYQNYYGAYMSGKARRREVEKLEAVLEQYTPDTAAPQTDQDRQARRRLAHRIARLEISLERWDRAERQLEGFVGDWNDSDRARRFQEALDCARHHQDPEEVRKANLKLQRLRDPEMAAVLLDFGRAQWKNDRIDEGRKHIQQAIDLDPANVDARIYMADTYNTDSRSELNDALDYYKQAFDLSPSDPRALSGFLHCKIVADGSLSFIPLVRPSLEEAIRQCRRRARVGVYLPRAYYDIGLFSLLLYRPYDSLSAYAKAVQLSESESPVNKALQWITDLHEALKGDRPGIHQLAELEWVGKFLTAAKVAKLQELARKAESTADAKVLALKEARAALTAIREEPDDDRDPDKEKEAAENVEKAEEQKQSTKTAAAEARRKALAAPADCLAALVAADRPDLKGPVVFVAGGCDQSVESRIREYRSMLEAAFQDFHGTICSGGTKAGISGLVGDLLPSEEGAIDKISYVPTGAETHEAYKVYPTAAGEFSALEPLQNWIALLLSTGMQAADVRLLGINGGEISAFEFRMALAFGAKVGIFPDSGRAAGDLLEDENWNRAPGLLKLPFDCQTVKVFVQGPPTAKFLSDKERTTLAREAHNEYRRERRSRAIQDDAAMADWKQLPKKLQDSNLNQVDYIGQQLRAIGLSVRKLDHEPEEPYVFSDEQVEELAEMEHGRWNVERLSKGWTYGEERDHDKKTSPYLVPWSELPEEIKEYDRIAVRSIPKKLKKVQYEIIPLPAAAD